MTIGMLETNIAALAAAAAIAATSSAGIVGFVGDSTLEGGWYAFEEAFDVDMTVIHHGGESFETVSSIDVPEFGGSLDFDTPHSLRHIGDGWMAWAHGYTGEVFYNNGVTFTGYDLNMNDVQAFDAYIQPNPDSPWWFYVTAYGSAGGEATVEFDAMGYVGTHFGFFASGETIARIEITGQADWAIAEWRVGVPSPGALALFAVAGLCRARRRRN